MKVLPVFQDGKIVNDAGQLLLSYHYFPEDSSSRTQLYALLEFEKARALSVGPENHQVTEFTSVIERYLSNSEGQRGVAALVTLCLAAMLKLQKDRPTLYGATKMAAQIMKKVKDDQGRPFSKKGFEAGEVVNKPIKAVSGRGDVEKRFRRHSSVGALKAASVLLSCNRDYVLFPYDLEADVSRLIRTIVEIEKHVTDVFPEYFPDPWRIGSVLPTEVQTMHPFDLGPHEQELFGVPSLW